MNPMGRGSGFFKFLVAPAVCVLLGFYLVGPYLGRSPKLKKMVEKATEFVPKGPVATSASDPSESAGPEAPASDPKPAVSVDVKPLPDESAPSSKPRRRRRHPSND